MDKTVSPKEWVKDLPEYVAGRTIEEIRKKYNLSVVYKLASNENIFGPSPKVIDFLKNNFDDINYYPDADALEIRLKISSHYSINKDNVIMGNGTDQIIEMICDCFIDKGDNIVTADPNFLIYEKSALKCGGNTIKIPIIKDNFRHNIDGIINAVDKNTKIIFLASPHNPTGTIISKPEFEKVLELKDVLIVMDEAYFEYVEDIFKINTIDYIKSCKNLIILRTFSKIFGLAGLRIGYGIADTEIIKILNKIRLPFNINLLAQKAACVAIDNYDYVEEIKNLNLKEKEKFYKIFDELGIEFVKSFANFILVNFKQKCDEIIEKLLCKGFIIRPGKNLGLPGYARITISTPDVNDRFLKVLKEVILN